MIWVQFSNEKKESFWKRCRSLTSLNTQSSILIQFEIKKDDSGGTEFCILGHFGNPASSKNFCNFCNNFEGGIFMFFWPKQLKNVLCRVCIKKLINLKVKKIILAN